MDNSSKEIEQLVAKSKKLQEINKRKQSLEETLTELTVCNNVAILAKKPKVFNVKVLRTSCTVVGTLLPTVESNQTLVISIKNVSKNIVFNASNWQLCVRLGERTQSTWSLSTSLAPGQEERFCCPLSKTFIVEKVCVSIKFVIRFESKMYIRSFDIQEFIIDSLYCLDPGALVSESSAQSLITEETNNSLFYATEEQSENSFPPVTRFMLRLDETLKEKLLKDIVLRDSVHRGFSKKFLEELGSKPELSVFYEGSRIDINFCGKNDFVSVKCLNSTVLSSVKASILRRLVTVEGITVEASNDEHLEKLHEIKLKLSVFESDCNPDSIDVRDLMELYLGLRDISESIRFSVIQVVD